MGKETTIFDSTVKSLMDGMGSFLSTKTVVGEPIHIDDTIIIPLVDVSFGAGAGAFSNDKSGAGGAMGGKMKPSAVLIIHDGSTRLINIAIHTGIDKILDMLPDFVERFKDKKKPEPDEEEKKARAKAGAAMEETIYEAADVKKEMEE